MEFEIKTNKNSYFRNGDVIKVDYDPYYISSTTTSLPTGTYITYDSSSSMPLAINVDDLSTLKSAIGVIEESYPIPPYGYKSPEEFEEAVDAVRDEYERKLDTIKKALNKYPHCAFCAHYNEETKICEVTGKSGNMCYTTIGENNYVNKFANL